MKQPIILYKTSLTVVAKELTIMFPTHKKDIIDQAFQFSRMYWISINQLKLSVIFKLREMVAQIYTYFIYDKFADFEKENLWFL